MTESEESEGGGGRKGSRGRGEERETTRKIDVNYYPLPFYFLIGHKDSKAFNRYDKQNNSKLGSRVVMVIIVIII